MEFCEFYEGNDTLQHNVNGNVMLIIIRISVCTEEPLHGNKSVCGLLCCDLVIGHVKDDNN